MLEANKVKVGLFVVLSVALFFCAIGMLGVLDALQPRVQLMTLFKESVQGLESGSPVKFRGVPIGKVSNIVINAKRKLIRVDMDIDLDKVRTENSGQLGKFTPLSFHEFLDGEIAAGLSCKMEFAGITGLKYLEIDYLDPNERKDFSLGKPGLMPDGAYYIPSSPSLLSGLRSNISEAVTKIASIDYKKIADELSASLEAANRLFGDPRFDKIIGHVDSVSGELEISARNINASFTKERMDSIVKRVADALASLEDLTVRSKDALAAAQIGETSASFREAVKAFVESKSSLGETLVKFNETMDSLTEFIRYMDEDPSSLIKGKRKAPSQERFRTLRSLDESRQGN